MKLHTHPMAHMMCVCYGVFSLWFINQKPIQKLVTDS